MLAAWLRSLILGGVLKAVKAFVNVRSAKVEIVSIDVTSASLEDTRNTC